MRVMSQAAVKVLKPCSNNAKKKRTSHRITSIKVNFFWGRFRLLDHNENKKKEQSEKRDKMMEN